MRHLAFLSEFVTILAAAVAVNLLSHRLRIPAIVGFLLTGLVIGPSGLALVRDRAMVEQFAELGVVLLLFSVGLEFSLERLREVRRAFLVGGSAQAFSTILATALVAAALGASLPRGIFFGFLVALSSTAIVLKLYADRRELEAPQGKLSIGFLLFQDFLVVPMMLLTPVLAGTVAASAREILLRFGLGVIVVAAVFFAARYLMPRLLYAIVRTRVREVFVLGALLLCLGMGLATESAGFSLALGAFLAGIIIAESEYSPQVIAEVSPFRDVFNSLFFISVGMLLDLDFAADHLGEVLALGAALVAVKAAIAFAVVRAMAFPARTALAVGLGLAQVGEFSFVLAGAARRAGLLSAEETQYFLAASILTMVLTPVLVAAAPRIAARLPGGREGEPPVPGLAGHVVVVGFGVAGRNLARVLRETAIPFVVVELNGETVREARAAGEPIFFGDATRRDILERCAVERAGVIVFVISDLAAVRQAIRQARALHPAVHIIVRTRRLAEIEELYRCGANEVVAEEFETSIEIFSRVLRHLHVPRNVIAAQEKLLRGDRYRVFRTPAGAPMPERLLQALAAGTTEVFFVEEGGPAAGRTIRDLDLRRRSGATIIAVVREERAHPNPPATLALAAGDSLVLVGSHAELERAFELLSG